MASSSSCKDDITSLLLNTDVQYSYDNLTITSYVIAVIAEK